MSTLTEPHTNGHDRDLGGVRTYRGRKLEDLIPQIRAELGPDAIILRQREGLMGGVGGFFAQKCVEVDAQAAPKRVDIYDEDEPVSGWDDFTDDDLFDATPRPVAADPSPIEFPALPAPQEPVAPPLTPAAQDASQDAPYAPEVAIPGPEAAIPGPEAAIPAASPPRAPPSRSSRASSRLRPTSTSMSWSSW